MKKGSIEKFSLCSIADIVSRLDLKSARDSLSLTFGAVLEVSGKVQKVVKREGQEKLVIEEPGDIPGFIVFAVFLDKLESIKKAKIRKGSTVSICGKFASFGASAVCLNECKLNKVECKKRGSFKTS
jgi:hypothetical protein